MNAEKGIKTPSRVQISNLVLMWVPTSQRYLDLAALPDLSREGHLFSDQRGECSRHNRITSVSVKVCGQSHAQVFLSESYCQAGSVGMFPCPLSGKHCSGHHEQPPNMSKGLSTCTFFMLNPGWVVSMRFVRGNRGWRGRGQKYIKVTLDIWCKPTVMYFQLHQYERVCACRTSTSYVRECLKEWQVERLHCIIIQPPILARHLRPVLMPLLAVLFRSFGIHNICIYFEFMYLFFDPENFNPASNHPRPASQIFMSFLPNFNCH